MESAAAAPPALDWHPDALARLLGTYCPGLRVQVLASVGSTNTELVERSRGGAEAAPRPTLLVAENQHAGRGRQGKRWQSAPGRSLTFSLALPFAPRAGAAGWSGLSLAVGLALAETLDDEATRRDSGAPRLGLKWPNDLLLAPPAAPDDAAGHAAAPGRKLGGILVETVPAGSGRLAVVGVGLNVQPLADAAQAAALDWGYAHLNELQPGLTAPAALAQVALPLLRALLDFERDGFAPLRARYAQRDLLLGRAVGSALAEAPQGIADGVDEHGVLWLRCGARRVPVASGEVSLLPAPPG